jgi:hypothetical protein
MSLRRFTDSVGVTWEVWEVEPSRAERRLAKVDRRRTPRRGPDRRQQVEDTARVRISSEFTYGWLAFQAAHEKRRLAPVPDGWERLDDAGLEQLLQQAALRGRPRRLIE